MHVIGIVGGVASGKSTVSRMLRELGAEPIDADAIGHEVLREPTVIESLQNRWGIDVIREDGQIDRPAVAARVFGDVANAVEERHFLESVTHPRIREQLRIRIEAARDRGFVAAAIDAPLLFEGRWEKHCDSILFVDAPLKQRKARVAGRGWSSEELEKRENSQLPLAEKKSRSDFVVTNDGPLKHIEDQVNHFWRLHVEKALNPEET